MIVTTLGGVFRFANKLWSACLFSCLYVAPPFPGTPGHNIWFCGGSSGMFFGPFSFACGCGCFVGSLVVCCVAPWNAHPSCVLFLRVFIVLFLMKFEALSN